VVNFADLIPPCLYDGIAQYFQPTDKDEEAAAFDFYSLGLAETVCYKGLFQRTPKKPHGSPIIRSRMKRHSQGEAIQRKSAYSA